MEAMDEVLKKWIKDGGFPIDIDASIEKVLDDPIFVDWWQKHPEWSREQLLPLASKIQHYIHEQGHCQGCQGLHQCQNMMAGHHAELYGYGQMLEVSYTPCAYKRQDDAQRKQETLIRSHHIPKEILSSSLRNFEQDDGRADAFEAVLDFCLQAKPGEDGRGLYLYGPLGAGKSYLLGAACNKLAERNIASYMIFTPSFFREIKGAIADQSVEQKIEALQKIPVLILDDIGAETMIPWIRDDILSPVLQYRVMEQLPTLYTSNYNYDQLEEHMAYTQRAGVERIDELKAKRMIERIRHYTDAYHVHGKNRRAGK